MIPDSMSQMLPLLVPLIILQLGLLAMALFDLIKRERVRFDNKLVWGALIVFLGLIGPLAYFVIGREES